MDSGTPPLRARPRGAVAGRIPLAVVVVDADGLVSHWSSGARRLFGHSREDAVGRPADDLMPVSGALDEGRGGRVDADDMYDGDDDLGPELHGRSSYPTSGRARLTDAGRPRLDVLWWAYPLAGPGPGRHLVLAADIDRFRVDAGVDRERIAPSFSLYTEFPDAESLAGQLPHILPNMSVADSGRIVAQVLELGYPVLEFSHLDRVPVTPDWGVPRRQSRRPASVHGSAEPAGTAPYATGHTPYTTDRDAPDRAARHAEHAPVPVPRPELDLEYAAVRERLEFLNEVSGLIGSSLDLSRTIREVTSAAVPRFADFAGTHLRAAVLAGEGFPPGGPT